MVDHIYKIRVFISKILKYLTVKSLYISHQNLEHERYTYLARYELAKKVSTEASKDRREIKQTNSH